MSASSRCVRVCRRSALPRLSGVDIGGASQAARLGPRIRLRAQRGILPVRTPIPQSAPTRFGPQRQPFRLEGRRPPVRVLPAR